MCNYKPKVCAIMLLTALANVRGQNFEEYYETTTAEYESRLHVFKNETNDEVITATLENEESITQREDALETFLPDKQEFLKQNNEEQPINEGRVLNQLSLQNINSHQNDDRINAPDMINSIYRISSSDTTESNSLTDIEVTESDIVTTSVKQSIQINLNSDTHSLAHLIQNLYLRTPVAALVDTNAWPLKMARNLWETALPTNASLDIVLVPFNDTDIGKITYTKGGRGFRSALRTVYISYKETDSGGLAYLGTLRSSQLVPYDSAIFLTTDRTPSDSDLALLTVTTLIRKRIRLYVFWWGADGLDGHLQEVAKRTGGDFIALKGDPGTSAQTADDEEFDHQGMATLAVCHKLSGPNKLLLSVDTSIKSLLVTIDGEVSGANLNTPYGPTIDLLNATSVSTFSESSFVLRATTDVHILRIGLMHKDVDDITGEWMLETTQKPNSEEYNLTIQADTGIRFDAKIDRDDNPEGNRIIRLRLKGPIDAIEGFTLIDGAGREISQLAYKTTGDVSHSNLKTEEFILPVDQVPEEDFYVRLTGKDGNGSDITRLSYVSQEDIQRIEPTLVELSAKSQLLVTPGTTIQIQFEITNFRDEAVMYYFTCRDEQRYLQHMHPQQMLLAPDQTSTVLITATVPPNASPGTTNRITLSAQGREIVTKSASLQVVDQNRLTVDTENPTISYSFGSRCEGKTEAGKCREAMWTLDITAKDTGSGLLRITSTPRGLTTRSSYTAGTRDDVRAFYSASCCNPRVTITAIDLSSNQRSVTIDVTDILLETGTIAAIVCGVLLLIVIIILIALLIRMCIKKRQQSRDLPAYRSERARI